MIFLSEYLVIFLYIKGIEREGLGVFIILEVEVGGWFMSLRLIYLIWFI